MLVKLYIIICKLLLNAVLVYISCLLYNVYCIILLFIHRYDNSRSTMQMMMVVQKEIIILHIITDNYYTNILLRCCYKEKNRR